MKSLYTLLGIDQLFANKDFGELIYVFDICK